MRTFLPRGREEGRREGRAEGRKEERKNGKGEERKEGRSERSKALPLFLPIFLIYLSSHLPI
jgi:hypothetical protein